jgi:predicted S18 family serine protease
MLVLGLIVTLFVCDVSFVFAQTDKASLKLQEAQVLFEESFTAVLDAESVNANVTSLLNQLNDVASLLTLAENAYNVGDNNLVISNADNVIQMSKQISSEACTLKDLAAVENQNAFWIKLCLTVLFSVVFVLVMFTIWRQFKQRYTNNAL